VFIYEHNIRSSGLCFSITNGEQVQSVCEITYRNYRSYISPQRRYRSSSRSVVARNAEYFRRRMLVQLHTFTRTDLKKCATFPRD
jgi:hypothetical protein